jgi:dihydrodipicolinate synthase/N-acetylneuraminate lyase
MSKIGWAGIYPSLVTPFLGAGDVDVAGQRAVARFAVESGAHGVLCFGLAGEVFRLLPDERIELLHAVVAEVDGEVPVLAGVGTEAEHSSIELAKRAAAAGADGIVIPPPLTAPASTLALVRYFERISAAVELPVMVQDAPEYLKVEVGPGVMRELLQQVPNLAALKLEVGADGLVPWVEAFGDQLSIFCGNGGLYLLDCLDQGADGVAPAVDIVDVLVEIYGLWQSNRSEDAWERQRAILPMLVFEMQTIDHCNAAAKYVLQKRGVLSSADMRAPAPSFSPAMWSILDQYFQQLDLATAV